MKAALAVVLVSLAACGAPNAFENRERLPSCGRYENRNQPQTADERAKNRCIVEAFRAGRRAELVAVRYTVEGDPFPMYVRVLGRGRVEIFLDGTKDAFGDRRWSRQRCDRLALRDGSLDTIGCREVSLNG